MKEEANPLRLLRPWQVALILGLSERTLERYRARKTGPEFIRVGNRIRYSETAVLAYLKKATVRTAHSDDPTEEPESLANLQALMEELLAVLPPGGD